MVKNGAALCKIAESGFIIMHENSNICSVLIGRLSTKITDFDIISFSRNGRRGFGKDSLNHNDLQGNTAQHFTEDITKQTDKIGDNFYNIIDLNIPYLLVYIISRFA